MTISAVLLAGGESRRMGKDKAVIAFRGRPLWEIQLELLRQLEPDELFVSAKADPAWRPADAQFVADQPPSRGPMSGIAAALTQTKSDHLLALAIDTPFMTLEYLRQLLDNLQVDYGIVPMIDNCAEPLVAVYPRNAAVDFGHALSGKNFSLQPLVARLIAADKLRPIPVSDEKRSLFRNLNEPDDLRLSDCS